MVTCGYGQVVHSMTAVKSWVLPDLPEQLEWLDPLGLLERLDPSAPDSHSMELGPERHMGTIIRTTWYFTATLHIFA